MAMLDNHLEQISLSAKSIAELEFPPPQIFTNALLGGHEITSLIRDTEPHERALFSLDPSVVHGRTGRQSTRSSTSQMTGDHGLHGRKGMYSTPAPRKQSAVARVLGNEMLQEIQQSRARAARLNGGGAGGVNIEVLLQGAERLSAIYPIAGVTEKIITLRNRHLHFAESIEQLEERLARQQSQISRANKDSRYGSGYQDEEESMAVAGSVGTAVTEQDIDGEEKQIRELEAKKRALEMRVMAMERDIGDVMR